MCHEGSVECVFKKSSTATLHTRSWKVMESLSGLRCYDVLYKPRLYLNTTLTDKDRKPR